MYHSVNRLFPLALCLPLLALTVLVGCARTNTGAMDDRGGIEAVEIDRSAVPAGANVVQTIAAIPQLSALEGAVVSAGLADALSGEGPFTVFAPTDDAFGLIAEEDLNELMMEENRDQLAALLQSHVAEGEFEAGDLSNGTVVVMLSGEEFAITNEFADPGQMQIGNADIVVRDIEASTGVIHGINLVLNPESGA
ncbi:MAG: fasciclin domain-containing protein [Rhodothermales bacterium]|nr:fasciclin domain-containing protein [Rhodothermales bacterium]